MNAHARTRAHQGALGYHAGLAAENQIEADYARRGYPLECRRWRGQSGEIDLIVRDGDGFIVVEVKKSRSFDRALDQLGPRQCARIFSAAEEFLGTQPKGLLTDVRFDVAMVDSYGQIQVLENALAA